MVIRIIEDKKLPPHILAETDSLREDKGLRFGFIIRIKPQLKKKPCLMFVILMHEFIHVAFYIAEYFTRQKKFGNLRLHHKYINKWIPVIESDVRKIIPKTRKHR